jgi:hypothetical protein
MAPVFPSSDLSDSGAGSYINSIGFGIIGWERTRVDG